VKTKTDTTVREDETGVRFPRLNPTDSERVDITTLSPVFQKEA
jgi:hypothetical protein